MTPFQFPMTKDQYQDFIDPDLNKLWGILTDIRMMQYSETPVFIKAYPTGKEVPVAIVTWLRSKMGYIVTDMPGGAGKRIITEIRWN